jgi:hypothetical protein
MARHLILAVLAAAFAGPAAHAQTPAGGRTPAVIPPAECTAHVGYDRDLDLSGFLIKDKAGVDCVPFTATAAHPPAGYKGDFYVDEFTDAKLKARWADCQKDEACRERMDKHIKRRKPPNREHDMTKPRQIYLLGKIDQDNPNVDLKTIRRPAFFAQAPYAEAIAEADPRTFVVEFTAPGEPYERLHMEAHPDVKLRGWYLQGAGVDDGKGHKVRALAIMSNGGGGRIVAIEDPSDKLYHMENGHSELNSFPNETTGASGQRGWRDYLYMLNKAGFDVMSYDRRGVGVSSGYSDTNTLQQGRDILKVIGDLKTGDGVRVLTPKGAELKGEQAASALMAGGSAQRIPILLGGSSRGTMAAGWAMTRNFEKACDYDLPGAPCGPAPGIGNIKGAMMISDFSAGIGYLTTPTEQQDQDRPLFVAGTEERYNIVFFPGSQPLESMSKWPALFIARGAWDYAESLEGAIDAIGRVKGPKELVVVRGPHPFETWPDQERIRVGERMVAFARAVVLGQKSVPGGRPWATMKDLVATTDDVWEPSTKPPGR